MLGLHITDLICPVAHELENPMHLQVENQVGNKITPSLSSQIVLDSQSTADVYSNPDLLTNIHEVKGRLTIHTQAETKGHHKIVWNYAWVQQTLVVPQRHCKHSIPHQCVIDSVDQV